jgi:hypothetical protein
MGIKAAEVPLADARAAMEYQKSVLGTATGRYDAYANSCVTHCGDVLRAGGLTDIPNTTNSIRRYLQNFEVK